MSCDKCSCGPQIAVRVDNAHVTITPTVVAGTAIEAGRNALRRVYGPVKSVWKGYR